MFSLVEIDKSRVKNNDFFWRAECMSFYLMNCEKESKIHHLMGLVSFAQSYGVVPSLFVAVLFVPLDIKYLTTSVLPENESQ